MKQNLLNKLWLRVCMIVAIMTTALSGTVWAEDVVTYTLNPVATGSNSSPHNSYAAAATTTIDEIEWSVMGNSYMVPWRIGGKNLQGVDRELYSKTAIADNISKVVVTNGTATATVNSMTLIVSSNSDFTNPTSTVSGSFVASSTTTFERPTGVDWSNKYFKLVYNVTAGSSNQYAQFVKAEFFKSSANPNCTTPTFSPEEGTFTSTQSVTISTTPSDATIYYTIDGTDPTTSSSVYSSAISVNSTTTIKAMAVKEGYNDSQVATATYTIVSIEHAGTEADPYTVADARNAIDAGIGVTGVYATGIVSKIITAYSSEYGNISYNISVDGTETADQLQAYRGKSYDGANFTSENDIKVGDVVVVYGNLKKYNSTYEFDANNELVSLVRPGADPVINAENVTIVYNAESGAIEYTIDNAIEGTNLSASTTATWLTIGTITGTEVPFTCTANDGSEDRIATVTLSYDGAESVTVTVTQGHYVAEFATLPFEFDGGKADIEETAGLTQNGLGSDYKNAPHLKFDGTGDYIVLAFNERPGVLTFDILGNSFSGGTFTVLASEDGEEYGTIATYTDLGATETKTISDLGEDIRFIKWIYTEKVTGNVGLGNINLAKYGDVVLEDYTLTIANPENVTITANYGGETILQNGENAEVTEGTKVTVALSIAEGYELESVTVNGTADEQAVTLSPGTVEGVYTFTMPAYDVTVNATAVEQETPPTPGTEEWVEVALDELTADDVFVIVGNNGSNYAMSNNNGTTSAPAAVAVTVKGDKITSVVADNIKWNISSDATGYTFYPDGETETWLYCTNNNNGVRVGAGDAKHFTVDKGYLTTTETDDQRYLGIYNSQDWRCYKLTNEGAIQTNIAGQTFKFYKKVGDAPTVQTLTVTSARYATMVAEANLEIPADVLVEVFAIKTHDSYATLLPVTGNIPAGEAVLVKADAGEYSFAYAQEADAIAVNELVGATEDVVADGTQYILANGGEGIGFYKATTGSTIKAGKAYLVVPAGIKGFYGFDEDDATGISDLNANVNANEAIYNLAGQRIQKMQRGINIVGGKKVLK